MRRWMVVALFALVVLIIGSLLKQPRRDSTRPAPVVAETNATAQPTAQVSPVLSPLDQRIESLKTRAKADFDKLVAILQPYGLVNDKRDVQVARRTNTAGTFKVEIDVASTSHRASFVAGPLDSAGTHVNPFLTEGPLLTLFASLHESSDTRENPGAANSWVEATGKWSESEAVGETLRLAKLLGHDTNRVVRYEYSGVPLNLRNAAGDAVTVTPFHKVDLYGDQDARLLGCEYRIGKEPPGKVTRWFNWPPIAIP